MSGNYVINIGRQLGSGGQEIGEKLAARLGINFYEKELINLASEESGLCKEFVEKADEKASQGIIGGPVAYTHLSVGRYCLKCFFLVNQLCINLCANQYAAMSKYYYIFSLLFTARPRFVMQVCLSGSVRARRGASVFRPFRMYTIRGSNPGHPD